MNYSYFIGIDVSKSSLSISVRDSNCEVLCCELENRTRCLVKFIKSLGNECVDPKTTIVCLEHTGVYGYYAMNEFYANGFNVWVEHALNIKNSIGMTRGKNDKIDAYRIAEYAFRYQDKIVKWKPQRKIINKLKKLYSVRDRLIKSKKQLQLAFNNSAEFEDKEITSLGKKHVTPILKKIGDQIKKVNIQIRELIKTDERLVELTQLITSVPGVGEVVSWKIIITTNEFINFTDGRKFACYSGVVPFTHQSGTSLRGKCRVSHMANKEMKSLLHLSAVALISRGKGELYNYYLRKVNGGKAKMLVINALKNKIIQRIFACVNENRKYEESYM